LLAVRQVDITLLWPMLGVTLLLPNDLCNTFPPLFYCADNQDLADRVCATAWSFLQMLEVFVVTHRLFCGFNTEQKTEKNTRMPCCRREPPRDAGHLHRKLEPNPRATQWI